MRHGAGTLVQDLAGIGIGDKSCRNRPLRVETLGVYNTHSPFGALTQNWRVILSSGQGRFLSGIVVIAVLCRIIH